MIHSERIDGYLPISAYAMIGDCRSAALVGYDGSIDWLCLPRFDHPSIFGRLLDAEKGGYWQIVPRGPYNAIPRYRDRSCLLQNSFATRTGRVGLIDFMPVHAETMGDEARLHRRPRLVRMVECLTGEMVLHNTMVLAPDYGRGGTLPFSLDGDRLTADTEHMRISILSTVPVETVRHTISLRTGEAVAFALVTDEVGAETDYEWTLEHARSLLRETREFWWHWMSKVRYDGPYMEPVWRSALALKMMTYTPTGAIIAAPTTSLPEKIGGQRNWDYRFTWLRDASFVLFAFFQLGLTEEAHAFFDWLTRIGFGDDGNPTLDNLYTLDGKRNPHELVLEHLTGYRDSRPVRIGNGAARQLQLDVYGEVLDSAYLYARFGGEITETLWRDLRAIVDLAIRRWEEPDSSIWEVRGGERQFTYSKVMCWVAVDRGLRIAERYRLPHDSAGWKQARVRIHRRVVTQGFSKRLNAFTQTLGGEVLDASMLRLAQVRFLPGSDPRLAGTVEAIASHLREGVLLRRYDTAATDDGMTGDEGAFLPCSFWLVDAFAHMGDLIRAQRAFEHMLTFLPPSDLLAEESDPRTGDLLGNYPQAFTHLGLIGAAVNIERLRHRQMGAHGLR